MGNEGKRVGLVDNCVAAARVAVGKANSITMSITCSENHAKARLSEAPEGARQEALQNVKAVGDRD